MAYTRSQLIDNLTATAIAYGINPGIAVAQIQAESSFNPNAVSPAGAQGLAQFMPGTWARFGSGNPFDPDAAIQAWANYMSYLLARFGYDYGYALAAYNWGEDRQALNAAWNASQPISSVSLPNETRNYLAKILPQASGQAVPTTAEDPQPAGWLQYLPFILIGAVIVWAISE